MLQKARLSVNVKDHIVCINYHVLEERARIEELGREGLLRELLRTTLTLRGNLAAAVDMRPFSR